MDEAYFGGGCFWNAELVYSKQEGVIWTEVGWCSYKVLGSFRHNKVEVVRLQYDPELTSYAELVDVFWGTHNPLSEKNSKKFFVEKSVLFVTNEEQKRIAQEKLSEKKENGMDYLTEIHTFDAYKRAPEKDQQYYFKT